MDIGIRPSKIISISYRNSKIKGGVVRMTEGFGAGFALIVVLFILLIIVGTSFVNGGFGMY